MYLLFDIGGTNMRLAVSDDGQTILETKIAPTPQKFEDGMKLFGELANELSKGEKIEAAGGGVAGPFNKQLTELVNAPHLRDWVNRPLAQTISNMLHVETVFLENDAAVAGLGEANFGAGKNYKIVAFVGIGTGVGGVRIVDKHIDDSYLSFEPGHMIINSGKTWESYISGSSIIERKGILPSDIQDRHFWTEFEEYLVIGLNNLVVTWSPNVIVLGGTIGLLAQVVLDRVTLSLYKTVTIFPQLPKVVKGTLADRAGLYGALAMINNRK